MQKGQISQKYNKLVWAFIGLSFILVIFIAYFAFSKTTITIIPQELEASADFQITLNDLHGEMLQKEVEGTQTYTDFTDYSREVPGQAYGQVEIVNNYVADQPLVATTRLQAQNGMVFRTQEDVIVPAGASAMVNVLADEEGAKGDVGPGKFTIVALYGEKKDLIYGQSSEAMQGGTRKIGVLTEEDIKKASEVLSDKLVQEAVAELKTEAKNPENLTESKAERQIAESDVDAEVGDEVDQIEVYEKMLVSFLTFDDEILLAQAKKKLQDNLGDGYILVSEPSLDDVEYQVLSLEEGGENAVIKITVRGKKIITADNQILNKKKLFNKTKKSIGEYFNNFDEIKEVKVVFSPFWVQTAPVLEEHINIRVEEP